VGDRLSDGALALIERPVLGHLATEGSDGRPHATPVWIDHDEGDLLVNSAEGRVKTRDMRRSPYVAVSVVAPDDPYLVVAFRGTVVDITTEGADEHIDALAKKYLGLDAYPNRKPGEVRLKIRIRPERIAMQPSS
jgi:PPOX class probable F420-dependent enzyme